MALTTNTNGRANTAVGSQSMQLNTTGIQNAALGNNTLTSNTTGNFNTGIGSFALTVNTTGSSNTGIGSSALNDNTTGSNNTAVGVNALGSNITGSNNTAVGAGALIQNTSGNNNIAIGNTAGGTLTTGSGNIYINANAGSAAEANTTRIGTSQTRCFIAGISGRTTGGAAVAVLVDANGQLGTISSSEKVKHDIKDMGSSSDAIMQLRPVTFAYNGDESETTQYGLIAEEVDKVFPGIVVHDKDGQPETVQYHVLPVLLLNEMKKQGILIEELRKSNVQRDAIIQDLLERVRSLEFKA